MRWACNGRLNYCSEELLQLMKDAGCRFINYGIESMDQKVLNNMKKGLRPEMIIRGVEDTLKVGISPGLNFIFGNKGDNKETIKKTVDFLLKYDDFSQKRTLRPVTPYPGSPLYYDAIEMGLLDKENPAEDFYENKHLNSDLISCNFTELTDDEYYECLRWANSTLMKNYFDKQKHSTLAQIDYLYKEKDVSFRGFRHNAGSGQTGDKFEKGKILDLNGNEVNLNQDYNKKKETHNRGNQVLDGMTNWESSTTSDGERFSGNSQESDNKKGLECYNTYLKRKAARAEAKKIAKQTKIVQSEKESAQHTN